MQHTFETCRLNFKHIGRGTGRAVFEYAEGLVIKVPCADSGFDQNGCEVEIFKLYGDRLPLVKLDLEKSNRNQIVAERVDELPDTFERSYNWDVVIYDFSMLETDEERFEFTEAWKAKNILIHNFFKAFLALTPKETSDILFDVCAFNMGIRRTEFGQELVILDYGYSETEAATIEIERALKMS